MPKGICDSCDAPIDASDWWKPHNLCRLCEDDIASPEKNDKEQPMTTTNTTPILELWEAMGEAGIQPDGFRIETIGDKPRLIIHINGRHCVFDPGETWWTHFGFILTGHAETWLRGRCDEMLEIRVLPCGKKSYLIDNGKDTPRFGSLPEAILAEVGRGG